MTLSIGTPSQKTAIATLTDLGWVQAGKAQRFRHDGRRLGRTAHQPIRVPMIAPFDGQTHRVWVGSKGKTIIS
jgi:hypothetical protein